MSLASPLALLWFTAIIPIVGFYILKVRLRRVPVSTLVFWRQIYNENQPRSICASSDTQCRNRCQIERGWCSL